MREGELVIIFNASSEIEALLYREMLEEAGIDVIERPTETSWLEPVLIPPVHSRLLVLEGDAPRAAELIEAFRAAANAGELALPENGEEERAE